eukprot:79092-Prorocentrum_minimum.AAC.2
MWVQFATLLQKAGAIQIGRCPGSDSRVRSCGGRVAAWPSGKDALITGMDLTGLDWPLVRRKVCMEDGYDAQGHAHDGQGHG